MGRYALRRLLSALLLALFVSFLSYVLIYASGDPAVALAGESGSAADAERMRLAYGLDQPVYAQYLHWVWSILHGNFGRSLYFDQPVSAILAGRLGVTMILGVSAIVFALAISLPLGIAAARWQGTAVDHLVRAVAVIGQAMPTFWFALLLVILLSVTYPILPTSGSESWRHFIMPTITLGYFAAPALIRLTRSGMIQVLEADYIRTARAMGIPGRRVLFRYALRNAVIPVVSLSAAQFGYMLAGSVVVETVFAVHGAGLLASESIKRSDLPTIQALVLCFSLIYVLLTLAADLVNAWLDPRMRGR
jgi:peptide/nickel transport system permease protein